ncbi:MAG: ABC transporter ATP-binding protein [Acidobacteria bacterium]|jgi:ABC-type polysaccharide/polyol phosphate transport system ATPase subunit|nr:ABC transporter ATP-binding protein [Acidobacteriota bacterium]
MIDLEFNHVSKRYIVRQEVTEDASRHRIIRKIQSLRRPAQEFWAVRDVSFEVERGETLGIIGHNGAGKSTILKLLANITTPTSGEIAINGQLSALIEVGSGFHPELSGRENIYLNGSILGMRRREITKKLDKIVDFAGIRQFLDTPVKRFSSGMYVRLGFSIAAHLDPDILLLDEVLAVGDAGFQAKCLQRIKELKQSGTTIVFISHDLGAVERVCDRVLLMKGGGIIKNGSAREVINAYENDGNQISESLETHGLNGNNVAKIRTLSFHNSDGENRSVFKTGEPFTARVKFEVYQPVKDAIFDIIFYSPDGEIHCEFTTEAEDEYPCINEGSGVIEFFCPELGLMPGIYYTDVRILERGGVEAIHVKSRTTMLRVDPGKVVRRGNFYMQQQWRLSQAKTVEEVDIAALNSN